MGPGGFPDSGNRAGRVSGAAVPGAEVKATQTATGAVRTTVTATDGNYVLPNLPTGPYTVEVTKQGFDKYVQTGITLQVATNPTIDVRRRRLGR